MRNETSRNLEYERALEKVKLNNPLLIEQQLSLDKEKEERRKKDNTINTILNTLVLAEILLVLFAVGIIGYGLIIRHMIFFVSSALRVITVISAVFAGIYIYGIERHNKCIKLFWSEMANKDLELYRQKKEEFRKAGYEIP